MDKLEEGEFQATRSCIKGVGKEQFVSIRLAFGLEVQVRLAFLTIQLLLPLGLLSLLADVLLRVSTPRNLLFRCSGPLLARLAPLNELVRKVPCELARVQCLGNPIVLVPEPRRFIFASIHQAIMKWFANLLLDVLHV